MGNGILTTKVLTPVLSPIPDSLITITWVRLGGWSTMTGRRSDTAKLTELFADDLGSKVEREHLDEWVGAACFNPDLSWENEQHCFGSGSTINVWCVCVSVCVRVYFIESVAG